MKQEVTLPRLGQKRDISKRDLIIKDADKKISFRGTYLDIDDGILVQTVGVMYVKSLYIHKDCEITLADIYAVSQYMKVYFIDARGYVLGKFKRCKKI